MADIINLNKVRKQKARESKAALAAANRVKFGRTQAQKALDAAKAEHARQQLEHKRLEPNEE